MQIIIPAATVKYIKSKTGVITLEIAERPGGCCIPAINYPTVRLGHVLPKALPNFVRAEVDGLEVYYFYRMPEFFTSLTVKLQKILFLSRLVADGQPARLL